MKKKKYFKSERLDTMRDLVERSAAIYQNKAAYRQFDRDNDIIEFSFNDIKTDMYGLGTALMELGLKDRHICILGENSYYWVISYLAVVNGVGTAVPIDKELTPGDISSLVRKSDSDVLICSYAYREEAEKIRDLTPSLSHLILMDPPDDSGFLSIKKLIQRGHDLILQGDNSYTGLSVDPGKMCEIVFTSGTTGANKGVMLSQKNIMSVVHSEMCFIDPGETSLSVLPINHTYECCCHILGGLYAGLTICFNDSLRHVMRNFKRFRPNFSLMVPLFLETIKRNIDSQIKKNGLEKKVRTGIVLSRFLRKFGIDIRKKLFRDILDVFGGKLDQIVCGGAPLRKDLIEFFDDIGINLINGYGITECAPLVAAHISYDVHRDKFGSVGTVIPACRVRISSKDDDGIGEIEVKGENVMLGYYKDEESNLKSFTDDGWFRTGDRGYLDKDGYLFLSGREKNLIILSNGKNVHPEELEEKILSEMPYVKEAVVFASVDSSGAQEQICAAVYIDQEHPDMLGTEDRQSFVENDISRINDMLPSYKQILQVFISEEEFEKTSTKKIIRKAVERKYSDV